MDGITITMTAAAAKFESRCRQMRDHVQTQGSKAVETQMLSIRQVIVNTSPVDTGRLKASWSPVTLRGPLAYGTGTMLHYAPTLEYGGYPKVGPRTIRLGGAPLGAGFVAGPGIYSQQAPLGFVRKALVGSIKQFRLRMRNVLRQGWGGVSSTDAETDEAAPAPPAPRSGRLTAISATGVDPAVLHMIFESFQRGR